ncbi:unnamed protein product, partial [Iphiclides podalirius]
MLYGPSAPISKEDFAVAYSNPVKDFIDYLIHKQAKNVINRGDGKNVTPGPSMIDVPMNTNSCTDGAVKDIYGACRIPW